MEAYKNISPLTVRVDTQQGKVSVIGELEPFDAENLVMPKMPELAGNGIGFASIVGDETVNLSLQENPQITVTLGRDTYGRLYYDINGNENRHVLNRPAILGNNPYPGLLDGPSDPITISHAADGNGLLLSPAQDETGNMGFFVANLTDHTIGIQSTYLDRTQSAEQKIHRDQYPTVVQARETVNITGKPGIFTEKGINDKAENEDTVALFDDLRIGALADGHGKMGAKASQNAIAFVARYLRNTVPNFLSLSPEEKTKKMADAVYNADTILRNSDDLKLGGTTFSMAHVENGIVSWVNAGDSRVGRLRNGIITWLSHDQSLLLTKYKGDIDNPRYKELARKLNTIERPNDLRFLNDLDLVDPEAWSFFHNRNATAGIGDPEGNGYAPVVEVGVDEVLPGDQIIICSDGIDDPLSSEKPEGEMEKVLLATQSQGSQVQAVSLVKRAHAYNRETSALGYGESRRKNPEDDASTIVWPKVA